MFQLTWQEFSRRPYIAKLPLHEQVRQFHFEQQRYHLMMEYVINNSNSSTASSGAGSGGSFIPRTDNDSINGYVEDDYVGDYLD